MLKRFVVAALCLPSCFICHTQAVEELRVINTFGDGIAIEEIIKNFSQQSDIPVFVEYQRQDEFKSNLFFLVEKKTLPDIVIIPADHLGLHAMAKYSSVAVDVFKTNMSARIWESSLSDGVVRGVPLGQGNHLMLYFNKALVSKAATNWDEILQQKNTYDEASLHTIAWNYDDGFYFLPFMSAFDAWPIVNGKLELNSPAIVQALEFYKSLRDKNLYSTTCNYECAIDLFASNKMVYSINGTWAGESYAKALGKNLGVAALPQINGKPMLPSFSTYVIAFPGNSLSGSRKAEIIKLVDYLQSSSVQLQLWELTGSIPVDQVAFNQAKNNATGYLQQTLNLINHTKPLAADQSVTYLWDAMGKGLLRQNVGALMPKQAAAYMQQLADRHVRNAVKKKQ